MKEFGSRVGTSLVPPTPFIPNNSAVPNPHDCAIQEFTVMCAARQVKEIVKEKDRKAIGRIVEDTIEKITKRRHIIYDRVNHSYLGEM